MSSGQIEDQLQLPYTSRMLKNVLSNIPFVQFKKIKKTRFFLNNTKMFAYTLQENI